MDNQLLLEKSNIKQGVLPSDFQTAKTGSRISLQNGRKVAIVVSLGDSTSATAVTFTLKQHNAASSGTTKDLEVAGPYYKKKGAETKFTRVDPASKTASYNLTTDYANDEGVVVFEVHAQDLDTNGGFSHVSLDVAAAGVAKIGAVTYHIHDLSYKPGYSQDI